MFYHARPGFLQRTKEPTQAETFRYVRRDLFLTPRWSGGEEVSALADPTTGCLPGNGDITSVPLENRTPGIASHMLGNQWPCTGSPSLQIN
ncbi:unnamed protein product [Lota lota]